MDGNKITINLIAPDPGEEEENEAEPGGEEPPPGDEGSVFPRGAILTLTYKLVATAGTIEAVGDNPVLQVAVSTDAAEIKTDALPLYPLIKPGILDVLLLPYGTGSLRAHRGDQVEVKAIVRNVGEGPLFGTSLKVVYDAGYADPALVGEFEAAGVTDDVFVAKTDAGTATGWVIQRLDKGAKLEFVFSLAVAECEGFDLSLKGENPQRGHIHLQRKRRTDPGNELVELVFALVPPCKTQQSGANGTMVLYPAYTNDEDQPFASPITELSYGMTKVPSLGLDRRITKEIESTHNEFRIFLGEEIQLKYTINLTQLEEWLGSGIEDEPHASICGRRQC